MPEIPRRVLSEAFDPVLDGKRLHSAVFLTFQLDPEFFELEVLPVFLDVPLSHVEKVRRVQLEDALLRLPGHVAVYYDPHALVGTGSAHLDVRRVPVTRRNGLFHPKNVLLLLEDEEPDDDGHHAQSLVVASMSANLTRPGWWANVEVCHIEVLREREETPLRPELRRFLREVRNATPPGEHEGLRAIEKFLRLRPNRRRRRRRGTISTRFYGGGESVASFIREASGRKLIGSYLEVISPFFDDHPDSSPIHDLIKTFQPKEVRIFLPTGPAGEAQCTQKYFEALRDQTLIKWGKLPAALLKSGAGKSAADRGVHAKVYRFFTKSPRREVLFVGSANLTRAAHQARGGNVESGFLVDARPPRRPDFWLAPLEREPVDFQPRKEAEGEGATAAGTSLRLRYAWDTDIAEAYWDGDEPSPRLEVTARDVPIGPALDALPPREWQRLDKARTAKIREILPETSLFKVQPDGGTPGLLLVEETGMHVKPSLLLQMSAADILRYWAMLTDAQRMAFLESRVRVDALKDAGADLVALTQPLEMEETLFSRFAHFFEAFGRLERTVTESLAQNRTKEARYAVFGDKYHSLGQLLERIVAESDLAAVDRYVLVLCAQQLRNTLKREHADFWAEHAADAKRLEDRIAGAAKVRDVLIEADDDMAEFLAWYERWFLRRVEPKLVDEAQA